MICLLIVGFYYGILSVMICSVRSIFQGLWLA